jgi:hypothetical protein
VGVRECRSIELLILDGNPIGEGGGRMLMTIPVTCGSRIRISCKNCDVTMVQPSCWFNRNGILIIYTYNNLIIDSIFVDPTSRAYTLNAENGYELAVLYEILEIVAKHPSLKIKEILYDSGSGFQPLELTPIVLPNDNIGEREMKELLRLKRTLALSNDRKLCMEKFKVIILIIENMYSNIYYN